MTQIQIDRNEVFGFPAAEDDIRFLSDSFIDNENYLSVLTDFDDPRCIIMGRTGIGKSALIIKLDSLPHRSINFDPHDLAIEHVSNSNIIRFLIEHIGLNLDVFFRLLWRNVVAVEVVEDKYNIDDEGEDVSFMQRILNNLKFKSDAQAIEYLRKYGSNFWQESDVRVENITSTVEQSVSSEVGMSARDFAALQTSGAAGLTEERKLENRNKSYTAISQIKARELKQVVSLVNTILDDRKKPYVILIDGLDEDWVDDVFRYRLIRALIDTARDMNSKISNLKIIISLRLDLIKRVYDQTKDSGFQEDKYEVLYVPISWSKQSLIKLVDARIESVFKSKYTTEEIRHSHILPDFVDDIPSIDYMIDRTLLRPRDLIEYFNTCAKNLNPSNRITPAVVVASETVYSQNRQRSVYHEWSSDYPNLNLFTNIFSTLGSSFPISKLDKSYLESVALSALTKLSSTDDINSGPLTISANRFSNGEISYDYFREELLKAFWRSGFVGIRIANSSVTRWQTSAHDQISVHDFDDNNIVWLHKMFWAAFGQSHTVGY